MPALPFQHVVRLQARQYQTPRAHRRRTGRYIEDRPCARLQRRRGREPKTVQPPSLTHGSHRYKASTIR